MKRYVRLVFPVIAMGSSISEVQATVLLFDQTRDAVTQTIVVPTTAGSVVPQDYGDNVTGSPMDVLGGQFTYGNEGEGFTPNVVVDYFTDTDARLWTTQYGDLTNVLFARINSVSVFSGMVTMFSQSDVLVEGNFSGPRHTAFDFSAPLSAQELLIQIDFSNLAGSIRDNIGMDNIRFGQVPPPTPVPAPDTAWLLGSGLVALVGMTHRGKKRWDVRRGVSRYVQRTGLARLLRTKALL